MEFQQKRRESSRAHAIRERMRKYRIEPRFGSVLKWPDAAGIPAETCTKYILYCSSHEVAYRTGGDLRSASLHEGFLRFVPIVAGQRRQ